MNKITYIKLKSLTLTGFRCFADKTTFELDDVTMISGSNGLGKTSIAHAVTFAFYGLTFFGEQAVERLINLHAKCVEVTVEFEGQDGNLHSLTRKRTRNKTVTLSLNGLNVRQADIGNMLCDKDVFLSLFNPLYFIERIGDDGREFLQKYLPVISRQDVLANLSDYEQNTLQDIKFTNPPDELEYYRKEIREAKREQDSVSGQMELLEKQASEKDNKYYEARQGLEESKAKLAELEKKQFADIDVSELSIQKNVLMDTLQNRSASDNAILKAKEEFNKIQARQYTSKYISDFAELDAIIKNLRNQHTELTKRMSELKIGDKCPVCYVQITPQSIAGVKAQLQKELEDVTERGQQLVSQKNDIIALDAKSKATFEEFKSEDIAKAQAALTEFEEKDGTANRGKLVAEVQNIEEIIRVGNLSGDELSELSALKADVVAYEADIRALDAQDSVAEIANLKDRQSELNRIIKAHTNIIFALQSFIAKRAEMSLASLKMPNVDFQLFEIVKSTGELKDAFRFTYKGTDYRSLSLSEKVKAGLEIAALLRKLTELELPIFIDNTESIASFDKQLLPSQTILAKVIKGAELSVTAISNKPKLKKAA